jgi:hypothetical protein
MGTIYWLVNEEKKAVLELGKAYRLDFYSGDDLLVDGVCFTPAMLKGRTVPSDEYHHVTRVLFWLERNEKGEMWNESVRDDQRPWEQSDGVTLPEWTVESVHEPRDEYDWPTAPPLPSDLERIVNAAVETPSIDKETL